MLAVGSFNTFALVIRYGLGLPVSWQFSFMRDMALRGIRWPRMMGICGWFLLVPAILSLLVTARWKRDRRIIGARQGLRLGQWREAEGVKAALPKAKI